MGPHHRASMGPHHRCHACAVMRVWCATHERMCIRCPGSTLREGRDATLVVEPLHIVERDCDARAVAGGQQVRQPQLRQRDPPLVMQPAERAPAAHALSEISRASSRRQARCPFQPRCAQRVVARPTLQGHTCGLCPWQDTASLAS